MAYNEICVLIDAEGYASSLMERGAPRVGRDYTLIPVLAPGVSNSKCTYLSGPPFVLISPRCGRVLQN